MFKKTIIKIKDCNKEGQRFWTDLLNAKTQEEGNKIVEERKKVILSKIDDKYEKNKDAY